MSDTKLMPCPNPWTRAGTLKTEAAYIAPPKVREREVLSGGTRFRVECPCGVVGPFGDTETEAAAAWNTRPAPALTPKQAAADEMFDALELLLSSINRAAHLYWKRSYAKAIEKADAALAKAGRP